MNISVNRNLSELKSILLQQESVNVYSVNSKLSGSMRAVRSGNVCILSGSFSVTRALTFGETLFYLPNFGKSIVPIESIQVSTFNKNSYCSILGNGSLIISSDIAAGDYLFGGQVYFLK